MEMAADVMKSTKMKILGTILMSWNVVAFELKIPLHL